jgi:hypothetical protein
MRTCPGDNHARINRRGAQAFQAGIKVTGFHMLFNNTTFLGIDPTAGQRPFVYVALDYECNLLALGEGHMDEVLAFAAGQREALVAVCGPRQPNRGLMADPEMRQQLSPVPKPGRYVDFRLAEYQLRQRNISIPQTLSDSHDCQNWMQESFTLFRRLEGFGYLTYPVEGADCQLMEVYPHACYAALLGKLPFSKNSLEGRLQRQLVLYENKVKVSDPMRFFEEITRYRLLNGVLPDDGLYSSEELDALVAAYTAWLVGTHPRETSLVGDPQEGQIVLPVTELLDHYQ